MTRSDRSYRTLDKDLGRITVAESAYFHVTRPILRGGVGILLGIALIFLIFGVTGQHTALIVVGAGFAMASWLGLSIGANDVGNSLGPAVGAGAIAIGPGLILMAAAQIAGAALAGHVITYRLAEGIVSMSALHSGTDGQIVMLSALIGAACWITIATGFSLPVSTSHSIVGAIAGAGLAAAGSGAVSWGGIAAIAVAWLVTPFASMVLAGALMALLYLRVVEATHRARAARFWLPVLIGGMIGLFVAYVAMLLPLFSRGPITALLAGLAAGIATATLMHRRVVRVLSMTKDTRPGMKRILRQPLLLSAVMMAFAHGAGDAGNVAGPLLVILTENQTGSSQVPLILLLLAGTMIALGGMLFGRRIVGVVGQGITRLNPLRALCITLATAIIVLLSSGLGLPVSSTHVAVGAVFGVGFTRELLEQRGRSAPVDLPIEERRRRQLIRRSHVVTITAAWVVTVPITALLGGVCCLAIMALI